MTPTNEAGHGLPKLPDQDVDTERGDYYSMDAMEAYGRACYALALSRGVPADMVLVPRELTTSMAEAAEQEFACGNDFSDAWEAAIATHIFDSGTAPAAAGAQGEAQQMQALTEQRTDAGVPCKAHPDAPHGFDRTASHSIGRYVCECEGWSPETTQAAAADGGVTQSMLDAGTRAMMAFRKSGGDWTGKPAHAAEAAIRAAFAEAALSSHRQAGDESKFRELAERWRQDGSPYMDDCARELLALVEKGAGS